MHQTFSLLPAAAQGPGRPWRATPQFRKLRPDDGAKLRAHLLRLPPGDRRLRFCGQLSDDAVRAHCAAIDWSQSLFVGCFVGGRLRGVCELRLFAAAGRRAELALTVEAPYQGRGLGRELLRRGLVLARNRYVSEIAMLCLVENRRMRALARRFDSQLALDADEVSARLRLPWPSPLSLLEELAGDARNGLRPLRLSPLPHPQAA